MLSSGHRARNGYAAGKIRRFRLKNEHTVGNFVPLLHPVYALKYWSPALALPSSWPENLDHGRKTVPFTSDGAVTGSVEIVWEYCIRLNLGGAEASLLDPSPCPVPANIQPTDSQRPHLSTQQRAHAKSSEVATVQPKESRCRSVTEAHWPQSCLKIMVSPVQIWVPPLKTPCVSHNFTCSH